MPAEGRAHQARSSPQAFPAIVLGIHTHNDTENAVAVRVAAVDAGARQNTGDR